MGYIKYQIERWEEYHNKQYKINKSRKIEKLPLYRIEGNRIICANEELAKELFNSLKEMLQK